MALCKSEQQDGELARLGMPSIAARGKSRGPQVAMAEESSSGQPKGAESMMCSNKA